MFDYLKGLITDKKNSSKGFYLTVEVNGVGYLLETTERDYNASDISDKSSKVYVSLIHREDSMNLYGFCSKEARDIFQILLSVSGVGAKMAIALLNEFDVCDLISLVISGNFKELTLAKGVGPKLAQKIILELKDKLMKTDISVSVPNNVPRNQAITDAQTIMLSLGYSEKEIALALEKIISTVENISDPEEILRKALTTLSM